MSYVIYPVFQMTATCSTYTLKLENVPLTFQSKLVHIWKASSLNILIKNMNLLTYIQFSPQQVSPAHLTRSYKKCFGLECF